MGEHHTVLVSKCPMLAAAPVPRLPAEVDAARCALSVEAGAGGVPAPGRSARHDWAGRRGWADEAEKVWVSYCAVGRPGLVSFDEVSGKMDKD